MQEEPTSMPSDELSPPDYAAQKDSSKNIHANHVMSEASRQFDQDNKGYLDDAEKRRQKYDTRNNNETLDLTEMKSIMSDLLQREQKREGKFSFYTKIAVLFLVLSVLGNFGMVLSA